ncbi:MAG: sugar-binding transcriptional regulator [Anaerolineales bacterium]|jgi:DNA-binding transcriptional regulator LsrR (DeoR family)
MEKSDRSLLGKISWLYYIDGLTQKEIGQRVGLSRLKVVRLLQRARAEGVVEINIAPDLLLNTELSRSLEDRFRLREAIITEPVNQPDNGEAIGRAGARFLERVLRDDMALGIGMGRTIASLLPHIPSRKLDNVTVRTLAGAYEEPGRETNAYNISWRLADQLDAVVEPLHCPLIVTNRATREALLEDRALRSVLDSLDECDLVLIGLGSLDKASPLVRLGYCTPEQLAALRKKGAVGEILGRFYSLDGELIPSEFDERILGIDIAQLGQIASVVALAYGAKKVQPMLGALRTGCIDVLITDRWTAEAVLVTQLLKREEDAKGAKSQK